MFNSIISEQITLIEFVVCIAVALVLGLLASRIFSIGARPSGSYTLTIAILPAIVTVVIMLVNGNIGAGLAVAGTFALVRFRSAQGTAREIAGLFFSVSLGLACGMGFIGYAVVFFAIMAVAVTLLTTVGMAHEEGNARILRVTIPENLDYDELFDDLFAKYTDSWELVKVKTANMGTLFELTYEIVLKKDAKTKPFIDELRCRNGNLNISCSREKERVEDF